MRDESEHLAGVAAVRRRRLALAIVLALAAFAWLANSSGLLSSNDGSHLALARALALRGETSIEPERALTLGVDLAERGGRAYSDRPPGTAFAALGAAWIGDRLDGVMLERALAQARAGREVKPLPGARPYLATYAKRAPPGSPRLAALIGSSLAIVCHATLIGLLGLVLIERVLRQLGFELDARVFALACLALATAWGPYAAALFSHVGAATAVAGFLLGILVLARGGGSKNGGEDGGGVWWVAVLTGLAGAWAIACDYLLLLAIVPASALAIRPRAWSWVLLGTAPIVIATLAYHRAAFGGLLVVGYDYQRNFAFARERGSTFSGNVLEGLWILWGLGRGAGLLAQAPIALVGLLAAPFVGRRGDRPARALALALLGFVPWIVTLAAHETPWGGGTGDHRYLIPLLPFAGVGLALAWARGSGVLRGALVVLALASAALVWRHFLAWHEAEAFERPLLGLAAAGLVFVAALGLPLLRRKLRPGAHPW
jgi:hypothetical protein